MPSFNLYPTANPNGTDANRRVEVGWQRSGTVQIASTKLRPGADRHEEFTPSGATACKRGRQYELDQAESPDDSWVRTWDGEFVDLDRAQINHLIATLRRARDQAYGRDE